MVLTSVWRGRTIDFFYFEFSTHYCVCRLPDLQINKYKYYYYADNIQYIMKI